jgi:AAHS family benzoate transporter-like MFS transporter
VSFLLAVLAILALGTGLPLPAAMAVVAVAGLGTVGTQILVNGYVATYFQHNERTAALGLSLGLGRVAAIFGPILGGWIAASALGAEWNFYAFASFAALGCLVVALVRRPVVRQRETPADTPLESPAAGADRSAVH